MTEWESGGVAAASLLMDLAPSFPAHAPPLATTFVKWQSHGIMPSPINPSLVLSTTSHKKSKKHTTFLAQFVPCLLLYLPALPDCYMNLPNSVPTLQLNHIGSSKSTDFLTANAAVIHLDVVVRTGALRDHGHSEVAVMKRLKAFGARQRRSSSDVDARANPKLSQVVGIIDSPPASSTASPSPSSKGWKINPLRSRQNSISSSSDITQCASSRLSNAGSSSELRITSNGERAAIVVAFDANVRDAMVGATAWAFQHVLKAGDVLVLLGLLEWVRGPLGYKCQVNDQTWLGANAKHLRDELALKKLEWSAAPGLQTLCESRAVKLVVHVKPAPHPQLVIVQEVVALGAMQLVLDKSLRTNSRQRKAYLEGVSCDVTRMRRSGGVDTLRSNPVLVTPTKSAAAAVAESARAASNNNNSGDEEEEELFTIDHRELQEQEAVVAAGYESDDLFSICDEAWRTSSFAAQLMQQQQREAAPPRASTVTAHDFDPAMASYFVPPRSSVDSGPRLDKRLLSLRLQLRDSNL